MENKISVLIITKNSEETISECIESVKSFASEVIVVDGGSKDKTRSISEKLGAKVVETEFKNFADQRNFAATLAENPWVFYIDSDEKATPAFAEEISKKISSAKDEVSGFYIKRKTFFLGRDWGFTDQVERVFKKNKLRGWYGVVHETPQVEGKLQTISAPILHFTHRNLEQMVDKTNEWSEFEAELRYSSGHPRMSSWRFFRVIVTGFLNSYFKQGGFRNGTAGLIESLFQGYSMFITYAKLWEKQQKN